MSTPDQPRPPLPPFTHETALARVQAVEDAWNSRDPEHVADVYSADTEWRNRDQHLRGRKKVVAFLTDKWDRELGYRPRKNLQSFTDNRIAVRFRYEWHNADRQSWRSYGNELWEFDALGYMRGREVSINDVVIEKSDLRVTPGEGELPIW